MYHLLQVLLLMHGHDDFFKVYHFAFQARMHDIKFPKIGCKCHPPRVDVG